MDYAQDAEAKDQKTNGQTTGERRKQMPFTENIELPPILEKILNESTTGETINLQEFRKKLQFLRLTKEDANQLEKWMKQKGLIKLQKGKNQYNVYIVNYHQSEIHINKK